MTDAFLMLSRPERKRPAAAPSAGLGHQARAHSKFAASAAERWFNCPGSVELSEGMPDKSSPWSIEGTLAHEVLEAMFLRELGLEYNAAILVGADFTMVRHARRLIDFVLKRAKANNAEVLVETRIYLDFIHPEMFGTFDAGIVDSFGTLDVFDYKYGAGHAVQVMNNLQMIFYALGLAHRHHWNFKRIRMWIDQPRVRGYDGPVFWELRTMALKPWVDIFRKKVERVISQPEEYNEGSWCHFCKAKPKCPLKVAGKVEKARALFGGVG